MVLRVPEAYSFSSFETVSVLHCLGRVLRDGDEDQALRWSRLNRDLPRVRQDFRLEGISGAGSVQGLRKECWECASG